MADYDVKVFDTGNPMAAISAAVMVAKALNVEGLKVEFREGFNLIVSKDSRVVDVYSIYQLTVENKFLKSEK